MTAAAHAKQAGFDTLKQLSRDCNTSTQTLNNWFNKNKPRFNAVVIGAATIRLCGEIKHTEGK